MRLETYHLQYLHFKHFLPLLCAFYMMFSLFSSQSFAQVTPNDPNAVPIEFMFYHQISPNDSGVGINGTMNDWKSIFKLKQTEPGLWKGTLELQPVSYDYKFVTYKDTVSQSGVTGYFTDPLNPYKGGPFANSILKVKNPMIYYFLPTSGSTITDMKTKISAKISVSNSSKLDLEKIVFSVDGKNIQNAKSLYDPVTKTLTYTPPAELAQETHTAKLKVFTTAGDSLEETTTFSIEGNFISAPYTFQFDSKSPNFNFLSQVTKVDVKGTFNQEGLNEMTDKDSDGVYVYTANLRLGRPMEYTYIINGGAYINDPDNPNLSSNHRTQVIKLPNPKPKFINFSPKTGIIYNSPKTSLTVSAHLIPADSAIIFNIGSLSAKLDGVSIPVANSNFNGTELDVKVTMNNLTEGRHYLELFGSDIYGNKAWPATYVFGIYPSGSGFNYIDGEGDDQGPGTYKYPSGIPAGSADIRELKITPTVGSDSLVFSIQMKKISDNTRLGFEIVNKLDADFINAPARAGIKIPEWNNRGIFMTLAPPSSAFIDTSLENAIFALREPNTISLKVNPVPDAINKGEFRFTVPVTALESVMGSFKGTWYLGVYSYLKDKNGTVKVDSLLGGQNYNENPNVYDVAFFTEQAIQERLLSNFSPSTNIGGSRLAVIGSDQRGFTAITPSDIGIQFGQVPEVKIYAGGGDLWQDSVKVSGFADVSSGSVVTLNVNNKTYSANTNDSHEFSVLIKLDEGVNKIYASVPYGSGQLSLSPHIVYNYIVDHKPKINIKATIAQNSVTLNASGSADPDNSNLSYSWTQDPANPQQVVMSGNNTSSVTFNVPKTQGEYYFTATAKNAAQKTGWARAVIVVNDSGAISPDLTNWHPAWVDSAVVYSIFVRTFSNEGTFNAVTSKMKQLKNLGINCIWLLPIHPTTGNLGPDNPGYAITDHMNILEQYGTKADFKAMVDAAHQNGIKVVMDLVIQHTSDLHPFMRDALKFKQNSPYYPFYMWDSNGNFQYMFTWVDLPSINYEAESTRDYLIRMSKYWQQEFNIDGYRCDVAHVINDLRPSGPAFWQRWRSELKNMKPDVFFLAEADAQKQNNTYFDKKFDAAYDWSWFNGLKNVLSGNGTVSTLNSIITSYLTSSFPKNARPFRFLENQDEQRFIEAFGIANTKTAAALLLTVPGVPMLYAGQEVGEETNRGNIDWKDPNNLEYYYQRLISIRKQNSALTFGDFQNLTNTASTQVYSYLRTFSKNNVITNINFGPSPITANISVPLNHISFDSTSTFYLNDELNGTSYKVKGTDLKNYQVTIQPNTAQILVLSDKQLTSIETAHKSIPKIFEISQNFPNPFNPSTTIRYQIPYTSRVTISIYNILGQKLTELVNTIQNPGYYNAVWNAAQVASGIYIYSIQADPVTGQSGFRIAKKMMLVK